MALSRNVWLFCGRCDTGEGPDTARGPRSARGRLGVRGIVGWHCAGRSVCAAPTLCECRSVEGNEAGLTSFVPSSAGKGGEGEFQGVLWRVLPPPASVAAVGRESVVECVCRVLALQVVLGPSS